MSSAFSCLPPLSLRTFDFFLWVPPWSLRTLLRRFTKILLGKSLRAVQRVQRRMSSVRLSGRRALKKSHAWIYPPHLMEAGPLATPCAPLWGRLSCRWGHSSRSHVDAARRAGYRRWHARYPCPRLTPDPRARAASIFSHGYRRWGEYGFWWGEKRNPQPIECTASFGRGGPAQASLFLLKVKVGEASMVLTRFGTPAVTGQRWRRVLKDRPVSVNQILFVSHHS